METYAIFICMRLTLTVYFHSKILWLVSFFSILSLFLAIVIKPSNIRIWIHDKDMGKLTQVLWEGQGNRLRTEVCSNNRVRKFLDAVPYVMVSTFIKLKLFSKKNLKLFLPFVFSVSKIFIFHQLLRTKFGRTCSIRMW